MKYASQEARKVIETIEQYGIKVAESDYFDIEVAIAQFWNTQIRKIIEAVMVPSSKTPAEVKIQRATDEGWAYFRQPIFSLLGPRVAAHRTDDFSIDSKQQWVRDVYNLITANYLVADFNMRELAILTLELPALITDAQALSQYTDAARRGGSRNIYYLHGIAKREHEARQGKLREIQEQREHSEQGWAPDPTIEEVDYVERRQLEERWRKKQQDVLISTSLNNASSQRS